MKHTPGPWAVNNSPLDPSRESQRIDGPDGLPIASTLQLHMHRDDHIQAYYEARDNARLVAASPEMFDSLKELAFLVETMAHLQGRERELLPAAEKARALIAHVEGKAS